MNAKDFEAAAGAELNRVAAFLHDHPKTALIIALVALLIAGVLGHKI